MNDLISAKDASGHAKVYVFPVEDKTNWRQRAVDQTNLVLRQSAISFSLPKSTGRDVNIASRCFQASGQSHRSLPLRTNASNPWKSHGMLEPYNPGTLKLWNPGTLEPSNWMLEIWNPGDARWELQACTRAAGRQPSTSLRHSLRAGPSSCVWDLPCLRHDQPGLEPVPSWVEAERCITWHYTSAHRPWNLDLERWNAGRALESWNLITWNPGIGLGMLGHIAPEERTQEGASERLDDLDLHAVCSGATGSSALALFQK